MHELSIASAIVQKAMQELKRCNGSHIECITVAVGKLAGIDTDALSSVFPIASEESGMKDTKLVIETVAPLFICHACGHISSDQFLQSCLVCDSTERTLISGRELDLVSLDIIFDDAESDDPAAAGV